MSWDDNYFYDENKPNIILHMNNKKQMSLAENKLFFLLLIYDEFSAWDFVTFRASGGAY